jgi:hypothetical protein
LNLNMRLSHFVALSLPLVARAYLGTEQLVDSLISIEK